MESKVVTKVKPLYTKVDVIQSLYPLNLKSPIFITIEAYSDEVFAQNMETETWASAETEFDAVEGLRNELTELYQDLKETPDEKLGKRPLRWKKFLCSIISD